MPKQPGIGGKKRKMGKKKTVENREMTFKEEMQDYAQVLRLLGDSRLEVQCMDGVKRMGTIRGKIKKRIWIALGDVVLVALREYEKDKCDIILKYFEEEVRKLKQMGEIPESIKLPVSENVETGEFQDDIVFEGDGSDSQEEETHKNKGKKNQNKDLPSSDSEEEKEELIDFDKFVDQI
jgi:translation initiation factor 1A